MFLCFFPKSTFSDASFLLYFSFYVVQSPQYHQGMSRQKLSTPPQFASHGALQAHSSSTASTRATRWSIILLPSSVQNKQNHSFCGTIHLNNASVTAAEHILAFSPRGLRWTLFPLISFFSLSFFILIAICPQLLAWEPSHEEDVAMVTVRPNFQDSVHVGYITGLKKFTEYFTSVLCFTTPGDGPRSLPHHIRTHEDSECQSLDWVHSCFFCAVGLNVPSVSPAPGPVGHLSFTEILDTSLKVSWKEPHEKNGILTGDITLTHIHTLDTAFKC